MASSSISASGAARSLLLLDLGVEVPDAVDQYGDAARAAEVRGELVLGWCAEAALEQVAQPAPFEIGRTNGLCLVTGQ